MLILFMLELVLIFSAVDSNATIESTRCTLEFCIQIYPGYQ